SRVEAPSAECRRATSTPVEARAHRESADPKPFMNSPTAPTPAPPTRHPAAAEHDELSSMHATERLNAASPAILRVRSSASVQCSKLLALASPPHTSWSLVHALRSGDANDRPATKRMHAIPSTRPTPSTFFTCCPCPSRSAVSTCQGRVKLQPAR